MYYFHTGDTLSNEGQSQIKANLKPKPKMEVPGNRQLKGANPIFLLFLAATLQHLGGPNTYRVARPQFSCLRA